jgi:phosphatidylserine/phosphatidylglycerophosphate/cardiolipin synthase-like enzyme
LHDVSHRPRRRRQRWLFAILFGTAILAAGLVSCIYWAGRDALPGFLRGRETLTVYFTPGDQTTTALVNELGSAKRIVHVQAYSFTSAPIAKALIDAKRRGVDVIAILDKSNRSAQYSSADFLAHGGISTYIDPKHAIAHNKVMIIGGETVVTGSFNFTKAAQESNAANLLIVHDKKLAQKYEANWMKHLAHSEVYAGR